MQPQPRLVQPGLLDRPIGRLEWPAPMARATGDDGGRRHPLGECRWLGPNASAIRSAARQCRRGPDASIAQACMHDSHANHHALPRRSITEYEQFWRERLLEQSTSRRHKRCRVPRCVVVSKLQALGAPVGVPRSATTTSPCPAWPPSLPTPPSLIVHLAAGGWHRVQPTGTGVYTSATC